MKLNSIKTGKFCYDGGNLFGTTPKKVWQEYYTPAEDNTCQLALRTLLLRGEGRNIVVDTGVGTKHADIMETFGYSGFRDFDELLSPYGLKKEDITDVVLTSLHFEHSGGATMFDQEDAVVPAFANATVHVGKGQWDTLPSPNRREKDMIIGADILPVHKAGRLNVVEAGAELCKGVRLSIAHGPAKGLLVVDIDTEEGSYCYAGDLFQTAANVPLDWTDAHDTEPLETIASKERILEGCVQGGKWLIFAHDDRTDCASIEKDGEDYAPKAFKNI